ncbi:MAG TPA: alpha/beta fold hydrolase [Acidimicrobiales bacterium]|nr:alpha/beta fold hydrolase [Acidimicrobiales bacterium]
MTSPSTVPPRLHFTENSPIKGLAVAERRVAQPRASVICVHGALDRAGAFARLARRLDGFDLVAYDRRGYQGSRDLKPLGLDFHLDDLSSLVAREAQRLPVILFGHSFGGVVTFGVALREFASVQLVVNYESPFPWILPRPSSRPPLTNDSGFEAERFFRRVVSDTAWNRLSEQQRESRRLDGPGLLSDLSTIQRDVAPYDIAQLKVPSTYVYGDAESADYYRALGVELAKLDSSITTVEMELAGHSAHLGNPSQVAELIHHRWDLACASA